MLSRRQNGHKPEFVDFGGPPLSRNSYFSIIQTLNGQLLFHAIVSSFPNSVSYNQSQCLLSSRLWKTWRPCLPLIPVTYTNIAYYSLTTGLLLLAMLVSRCHVKLCRPTLLVSQRYPAPDEVPHDVQPTSLAALI